MDNSSNKNARKVITGKDTRWAFASVWKARVYNGGRPRYSVCLIIPKTDDITILKIKGAMRAAYNEGRVILQDSDGTLPPLKSIQSPVRDGDLERPNDPAFRNSWFISAHSTTAPGIVDAKREPIENRSEVYSGVYGRASITLYAYNHDGVKGISCCLNNLQKLRDGEPLGRLSAAEDFADDDYLD